MKDSTSTGIGFVFSGEKKREGLKRPSRPRFFGLSPTPFPLLEPLQQEPPRSQIG